MKTEIVPVLRAEKGPIATLNESAQVIADTIDAVIQRNSKKG